MGRLVGAQFGGILLEIGLNSQHNAVQIASSV